MMRRCAVHVLLSLLLLASQQLAFAHAMSHWTGQLKPAGAPAAVQGGIDYDLLISVAEHQSCSQCLAFAQVAAAAGGSAHRFVPPELRAERVAAPPDRDAVRRTACVFHSRAPPSIV